VERLREELGIEARMVRAHGGVFEVSVDGTVVARKSFDGFPSEDQIVSAVQRALIATGA
jgi:predicted Rdx family selenoprotein